MADRIVSISDLVPKSDPGYANYMAQTVIPTDLNHDGFGDFIVQYWEQAFGQVLPNYTNDKLYALVSNPDGTYHVDNVGIFGTATPKLSGASRKYVAGDINGDGVLDYAFAMNSEDGRSFQDPTDAYALPAVLLSQAGGGYLIVHMGKPSWGHAVALVDNALGTKDVIFAGFDQNPLQVFRYQGGSFVSVADQYKGNTDGWAADVAGVPVMAGGEASPYIVAMHEAYDRPDVGDPILTGVGLGLFQKIGSDVSLLNFSAYQPVGTCFLTIPETSVPQKAYIYRFAKIDYLNLAFTEIVVDDALNFDGSITIIGKASASQVIESARITVGSTYVRSTETKNINILQVFKLKNGHLTEVNNAIPLQITQANLNFTFLMDVNRDGLKDIVAQVATRPGFMELADAAGRPVVYINDGTGHYQMVDIKGFVGNIDGTPPGPELVGYFNDIDRDGFVDLVTYNNTLPFSQFNSDFQISYSHAFPGILGSDEDDRLFGSKLADKIDGSDGNDTVGGGLGNDRLTGGAGVDTLSGGAGNDNLQGGEGNDRLNGDVGNDLIVGGAGNDRLVGGDGADRLIGGAGRDTLFGGLGADRFRFDRLETSTNRDVISDFSSGQDRVELVRSAFKGLATEKAGPLVSQEFTLGTKALTVEHHVIYDRATGVLYYDPDGIGAAAQVQIALLSNKSLLSATDILLV